MNLLILSNNPSRPSYRHRIGQFLPLLCDQGISIRVSKLPSNKFLRSRLLRSAHDHDAVLLHKKCLNYFDARILRKYSRKIIYDFDDAVMYSSNKPESDATSHARLFKRTVRMSDCVIAGNDYLAEHARRYCSNVYVLPTGLDTGTYLEGSDITGDGKIRLVWIGSQSTLKYLREIKPVLEIIGKENNNLILRIIADDFLEMDNMPVERHKWSLETQTAGLRACDIGLSPLPDNRFTSGKCGFKILQYFAAGLPVIASPVGINKKFINESEAGLLANSNEEWKVAFQRVINDQELSRQMAANGLDYIQQYDTSVIGKKFSQIILGAIDA